MAKTCRLCDKEVIMGKRLCDEHRTTAAASQKRLVDKRIQNYICVSCGKSMDGQRAKTICNDCADRLKDFAKRDKERRKAAGICRQCKKPVFSPSSTVFCEEHLKAHSKRSRERTKKKPCECGNERDTRSPRCAECREKFKSFRDSRCKKCWKELQETDPKNYCRACADKLNEQANERRKKLVESGKCIFCYKDKEPERGASSICQSCRDTQKERERK